MDAKLRVELLKIYKKANKSDIEDGDVGKTGKDKDFHHKPHIKDDKKQKPQASPSPKPNFERAKSTPPAPQVPSQPKATPNFNTNTTIASPKINNFKAANTFEHKNQSPLNKAQNRPSQASKAQPIAPIIAERPHMSVIKTNYVKFNPNQKDSVGARAAGSVGYGASHGTSGTKQAGHAKSASSYQNRDGAQSESQKLEKAELEKQTGQKYSNTYNSDGERMSKKDFKDFQNKLANSDVKGMRRIMISPDPELKISTKEMQNLTRDAMNIWKEQTGKDFNFSYAIHDGQSELHSHITMTSKDPNAVNMGSKQLENFKDAVDKAIQMQLDNRMDISQDITQEINNNNNLTQSASNNFIKNEELKDKQNEAQSQYQENQIKIQKNDTKEEKETKNESEDLSAALF